MTNDGSAIRGVRPAPLQGWSGVVLIGRGAAMQGVASSFGVLIIFESFFGSKWYYWGGACGALSLSSLLVGMVFGFRGYWKLRRERDAGYTTALPDATKNAGLFLLHPVTFAVIAAPYEPRPQTLGKAVKVRDIIFGSTASTGSAVRSRSAN